MEISSGLRHYKPVVCVLSSKKADLKKSFEERGVEVIFLDIKSAFWWIEGARKLKEIIMERRPAIVHATLFKSEIITRVALKKADIPQIGSFVNDSYSKNRYSQQTLIRNLKLNVIRVADLFTARQVDHFMSITNAIADSNSKALSVDRNKITTIYRGRNIEGFRVSYPAQSTPFSFLTVARLLKRKGYLELFDACRMLKSKGYQFKMLIAGDGPDFPLFQSTVSKMQIDEQVTFLKNRSDVPDLLAASHCFVLPSHYEGQGGALVEAMLAARPIIVSDIPVFREQISDGETGKLFEVFNAAKLSEQMEWMMNHYEDGISMGQRARKVAVDRFNIEQTIELHEELYSKIISGYSKSVD